MKGWVPSEGDENCRALSLPGEVSVRRQPSASQAELALEAAPAGSLILDPQAPGCEK